MLCNDFLSLLGHVGVDIVGDIIRTEGGCDHVTGTEQLISFAVFLFVDTAQTGFHTHLALIKRTLGKLFTCCHETCLIIKSYLPERISLHKNSSTVIEICQYMKGVRGITAENYAEEKCDIAVLAAGKAG